MNIVTIGILLLLLSQAARANSVDCVNILHNATDNTSYKAVQKIQEYISKQIRSSGTVRAYYYKDEAVQDCKNWLALGSESIRSAENFPGTVVGGGILAEPDQTTEIPIVSMLPSPEFTIKKLKAILPGIKTIHALYSSSSEQYIKRLIDAARKTDLRISSHRADNITQAYRIYSSITKNIQGETELIWITHDRNILDSKSILPFLLETSWKQNFPLVSSYSTLTKYGVLLGLHTNEDMLAAQLVKKLADCKILNCKNRVYLSEDLGYVLNVKVARHLSLRIPDGINKPLLLIEGN